MNWNGLTRYCKEYIGLINDNFLRISIWAEYVNDRNICKALECSAQYMVGGILKDPFYAQYTITHCLSMDISYEEFGDMVSLLMTIVKGLKQDLKN